MRRTYGPSLDGAAPLILASCRNVFEVATAWLGWPSRMTVPAVAAISARTCLRSRRTSSRDGGAPARHAPGRAAGAQRQRDPPARPLTPPRRDLQRAAADVQHEQPPRGPAEPATGGQ